MSEKLIIENRTDRPMVEILPFVQHVIGMGKISGNPGREQYCFVTTFENGKLMVSALRNASLDRLVVTELEKETDETRH